MFFLCSVLINLASVLVAARAQRTPSAATSASAQRAAAALNVSSAAAV